jgi:pyruvate dehydrogenase E2 component (dihydrolipoamide acetyltransferase)
MEFGTIIAWHKKPGDLVHRGDIIVDVETDKGVIEVEIWQTGTISEILAEPGQRVPVGKVLAKISEPGQQVPTTAPVQLTSLSAPLPIVPMAPSTTPTALATAQAVTRPARLRITPLARRIAAEKAVPLGSLHGTGFLGAITRADVEAACASTLQITPESSKSASPRTSETGGKERISAAMRHAIAMAMQKSKREIPHYYMQTEICMDHAIDWLALKNATRSVSDRLLPAILYMAAVARAIHEVPEMNGFWLENEFHPSSAVHIGMATSLRRGGLVAPAVHDVDRLTIDDLMNRLRDLVTRARAGRLRSSEISDATITVTSLGDSGVETVYGVIYPPQVAIVGFGKISEKPWAESGMVGARHVVIATVAGDHRASDGHRGGMFLAAIRRLLHEPEKIFS